jgi:hypothetical protein
VIEKNLSGKAPGKFFPTKGVQPIIATKNGAIKILECDDISKLADPHPER